VIERRGHLAALAVAVAGLELAVSFGGDLERLLAYALAAALGVAIYVQGERHVVSGSVFGNVLVGYAVGTVLGLVVSAGLLSWLLSIPADFALWRTGILMWGSWAGVGSAILSAFFVVGLLAMLR
jgi:hypothetical protein